jgi:hypothetical protein
VFRRAGNVTSATDFKIVLLEVGAGWWLSVFVIPPELAESLSFGIVMPREEDFFVDRRVGNGG